MAKLALIHTVKPLVSSFEKKLKEVNPDVEIVNILDEYIASSLADGGYGPDEHSRLLTLLKLAESAGSDMILATCSSLSIAIDSMKQFIHIPIYKIDEAMLTEAVSLSDKIVVVATAVSTLDPTKVQLERIAETMSKEIKVESHIVPNAFNAMKAYDMKTHDAAVIKTVKQLTEAKVIVLAQGSMAHLAKELNETCEATVLSSIDTAIAFINKKLNNKEV